MRGAVGLGRPYFRQAAGAAPARALPSAEQAPSLAWPIPAPSRLARLEPGRVQLKYNLQNHYGTAVHAIHRPSSYHVDLQRGSAVLRRPARQPEPKVGSQRGGPGQAVA